MTQHQLERACRLWQKRLRLSDWAVTVKVEPESEMPGMVGQMVNDPSEMVATLRLSEEVVDDPAPTMIHELLHLRMIPFSDGEDSEPNHEARETAINLLADCFLRAYPRRRK